MNELALFAGAGGGILGGKLLGWTTVCAVEIDKYAASVLVERQNDRSIPVFPIWDDVRTFDGKPWSGRVDVVSGGFPCQAFSTAARGKNNADDLWPEMRRIVADVAPRYVFAENVSREAIDTACDDLEQMGYSTKAVSLSASDLGGDHIRRRFWLCAHAYNQSELRGDFNAEVERLQELCKSVWQADPRDTRVPHGMAHRMERYRVTGNGQIPIVAATAWRILNQ